MADFQAPAYSKRLIVEAGKALRGSIAYNLEAIETFRIVHNWRASHLLPMRHLRAELAGKARAISAPSVTAARLKRMSSIRKKLRTAPHTLYQMQDIGGCRIILDDFADLQRMRESYAASAIHTFRDADDYVSHPKLDGYRGCHLVYRYHGQGSYVALNSNPILIEIQIRTKLQHIWATTVEAVGLVRSEDLKGGSGSSDWLRFFALMSSEFAAHEGTPLVPSTPLYVDERRAELRALAKSLDAIRTLSNYRNAIRYMVQRGTSASGVYIIAFSSLDNNVVVSSVPRGLGVDTYSSTEQSAGPNTVLVEVDKAEDLARAYPNYFLDVSEFADRLKAICIGSSGPAPVERPELTDWWKWKAHRRSVANYIKAVG